MAANLIQAAGQSYNNLFTLWQANTVRTKLLAFWTACNLVFDEQTPNDQPPANWIVLMADLTTNMPATNVPFAELNAAAQYVYRFCWLVQELVTLTLLKVAQGTAVLAAYNANLA